MKKKLFIVSDVHGHYSELLIELERVGFDADDENHIFVSCGDLFDRGKENVQVYEFVKSLQRKILIKGNHEDMLYRILTQGRITDSDVYNETDITVAQFLGEAAIEKSGLVDIITHAEKSKEILTFIDSMLDYYEMGKYVFTHGWLPISFNERCPRVNESWRTACQSDWEDARWLEWHQLYDVGAIVEGKIIVCGHRPARLGRMFDDSREPDCCEPFYGDGIIAIDAGTVRSGRVNALVIEEP